MATIFTPDDTHFEIAKYAIEVCVWGGGGERVYLRPGHPTPPPLPLSQRGIHVLVTKPAVKTVAEHNELVELVCDEPLQLRFLPHPFHPSQPSGRRASTRCW